MSGDLTFSTRCCYVFDKITRDSYFTTLAEVFKNHIVAENTYFANHIE